MPQSIKYSIVYEFFDSYHKQHLSNEKKEKQNKNGNYLNQKKTYLHRKHSENI